MEKEDLSRFEKKSAAAPEPEEQPAADPAAEAAEEAKAEEGLTEEQKRAREAVKKAEEEEKERKRKERVLAEENAKLEEEMYNFLVKKAKENGISVETYLKAPFFTPTQRRVAYQMYEHYKKEHSL